MPDERPAEIGGRSDDEPTESDAGGRPVADGGRARSEDGARRLEEIMRALASRRRRYVLYVLRRAEVCEITDLAREIVAMEQDVEPEEVNAASVDSVKSNLLHADLPLLQDAGLVDYDHRSGAIRYTDQSQVLERLLDVCADFESPSDRPVR